MAGLSNSPDNYCEPAIRGFPCDTEIKTNHGWKRVEDVDEGQDMLLVASPESLELHYESPATKEIAAYEGPMMHFETPQIDLMLTAGMSVYAQRQSRANGNYAYLPRIANSADAITRYDKLPVSGFRYCAGREGKVVLPGITFARRGKEIALPEREIDLMAWLEFFGFWLADGCWRSPRRNGKISYDVYIKQNEENEEYVLSLIRNIGFEPKIEHYRAGGYNNYCIRSRQLWEYLRQFGKSADKYIPEEFLCLAPEYLEALFLSYTNGDSSTDRTCIELSSCSRRLIDNIQELVLKLEGCVAQVREARGKLQDGTPTTLWRLRYVPQRKGKIRTSYGVPQECTYQGTICGLQMNEDKLVLLRRKGKIMWAAC